MLIHPHTNTRSPPTWQDGMNAHSWDNQSCVKSIKCSSGLYLASGASGTPPCDEMWRRKRRIQTAPLCILKERRGVIRGKSPWAVALGDSGRLGTAGTLLRVCWGGVCPREGKYKDSSRPQAGEEQGVNDRRASVHAPSHNTVRGALEDTVWCKHEKTTIWWCNPATLWRY